MRKTRTPRCGGVRGERKEPVGARPRVRHGQRFSCRTLSGVFGGGTRSESRQGSSTLRRRVSPRPARLFLPPVSRRRAVLRLAVGHPVARFDDGCVLGQVVHDVHPGEDASAPDKMNPNLLAAVEARVALKPVHRPEAVVADRQHLADDAGASALHEGGKSVARVVYGAERPRLLAAGVARPVRVALSRDERAVHEHLVFAFGLGDAESLFAAPPHRRRQVLELHFDWRCHFCVPFYFTIFRLSPAPRFYRRGARRLVQPSLCSYASTVTLFTSSFAMSMSQLSTRALTIASASSGLSASISKVSQTST